VLEKMSQPPEAGALVGGADVIPDIDGREGQTAVLQENDVKAVFQPEFLKAELRDIRGFTHKPPVF
jgi:hypothetical protein